MDNPIVKNVLAFIAGAAAGTIVNMGIIMASSLVIPMPEGVDNTDYESLNAGMHLLEPIHFLMPFLAHALGTLIGAFVVTKIAASHHMRLALGIGFLFLVGGIAASINLPASPNWFKGVDILFAYIPMAWLGWNLASKREINEV